jgi:cytochrome c peroxidase
MTPRRSFAALVAVIAVTAGFAGTQVPVMQSGTAWHWDLPKGFPVPRVPADNPMTVEKVELGRHLFYDTRLSGNQTFSCANCHQQQRAFADALPRGVGSTAEMHPRGSMALGNIAYSPALTWANPNVKRLEAQALVPMFGEAPVELGLAGKEAELITRISGDARYRRLFAAAFPGAANPVTLDNITKAIASFERTLITANSTYDRAQRGETQPLSATVRRGEELFFSERLECFHCHGGFNFTGTSDYVGKGMAEVEFHNTALYNVGGTGRYPADNPGVAEFTQRAGDNGKFKAPSLRNVALTAPYMHDGSIATLDGVLDHYAAGGRTITTGPNAGVGSENPNKSEFINGFTLTRQERSDLLAFLHSLTDSAFITNPRHANPWTDTLRAASRPRHPSR